MIDLSTNEQKWPVRVLVLRAAWQFIIQPLVMHLPRSLGWARIVALRLFGARIGSRCLIMPGVRVLMPWNLSLDNFVAIGAGVDIYNFAMVSIGSHTVVSQHVYLCTGTHDYTRASMPLTYRPISVGKYAWLCARAYIGPGVSIDEGVVVGACAVLSKSTTTPWSVWAGNPAVLLKKRRMAPEGERV